VSGKFTRSGALLLKIHLPKPLPVMVGGGFDFPSRSDLVTTCAKPASKSTRQLTWSGLFEFAKFA
jgi:hypothetical protein